VCTNLTLTTSISGSGLGREGWFAVDQAVVYFDHPQDAPLVHALCLDVRGPSSVSDPAERVTVELDVRSARRLAETILATLDHREVRTVVGSSSAEGA